MTGIIKFPRTHHLCAVGKGSSITRDDLLMDKNYVNKTYFNGKTPLIVEEKIDGANIGISIHETGKIVAQNRSHYVTSESAAQFKSLQIWIDEVSSYLWEICSPNDIHGPRVLYGEWCAALHTVEYNKLPSYFIAFDIFDIKTSSFLSVVQRNAILQSTPIPVIRQVVQKPFKNRDELISLLKSSNTVYHTKPTPVEGFYVRIDDETKNCHRGKVVQDDFIQTVEDGHWSKREMVKNTIDYEWQYQLQERANL